MDDQAETVLLHLARGAGVPGAAGMRPLRDGIARPLLAIGRSETRAMCAAAEIRPREDPSNTSLRFARNRVRLRVLPELERINPQIRAALARFADAAAEVEHATASDTRDRHSAADSIAAPRETAGASEVDVHALIADPAARERALAEAWVAAGGIVLSASHRAALLKLASTTAGSRRIDLPGGQAVREYAHLFFVLAASASSAGAAGTRARAAASNAIAAGPTTSEPIALKRGAEVRWHGWRIALDMPSSGSVHSGAVDAASAAHLGVRARRPGDRVMKMGKLQDLFVDAKIPARARDRWPLVTLNDAVIWVPGVTPAPQSGRVAIAAEPASDSPTNGGSPRASYLPIRQVASRAVLRPQGGKRGRP
jgi:tRNA(Ile)-lysidine synthetase-like protein